ncbi:hypothetical protein A2U01_0013911 [Trifolium medium]|uniref:Uncharacterized protein n=1 Tax=Trifolium medium TaxID=97028 RepID=A0A392N1A5_9FABA|nr:hypothetical protein [Trifolium medium]
MYSPGGILNALATALHGSIRTAAQYPSFTARTTGVSVRTHADSGPYIGLVNNTPPGPKVWRVYSRRGKQGEKGK